MSGIRFSKKLFLIAFLLLTGCQYSATVTVESPASTVTPVVSVPSETLSPVATPTVTVTSVPTFPASIVEVEGAEVPPGFSLTRFADLPRPTAFAFDSGGRMYAASQDGNIYLVTDDNQDRRADAVSIFASGYDTPLGIAIHEPTGDVYISHKGAISILSDINGDSRADNERILAGDLPFGLHQNDNLQFGPDGWLYVGVGSTCDACDDTNPYSAAILRFNIDTGVREIFATGLRNPFGIAFQPGTGQLFATDNGRDKLGMDNPFEELNHIVQGGDYGYPDCWDDGSQPGCENSITAVAFFEAHSSADGLDFYDGQTYPPEYQANAFVSIFGSWLKSGVQTGIQRVVLSPNGNTYTGETSWFVRFPQGVMPLPVAFGPDDALYVGDFVNGVIYRISYGYP